MTQAPRIAKAGFGDGIGWLSGGGELLGRGGVALVRIAAVLLVISLIQLLPVLGLLVLGLISPILTAGMLNVFRAVQRGEKPEPALLLAGFYDRRVRSGLLMLGLFFVIGIFVALATLTAWLAPQMDLQQLGALFGDPNAVNNNPEQFFALFQGVNVFGGLLLSVSVFALVLGALYFAVPLVFFWHWPVMAALLWSLRALLVNWSAFLGFGLVLFGALFIIGLVFGVFAGILSLGLGGFGALLVQVLSMVISLFIQLLVAAAQWLAFVEIFPVDASGGPAEGAATGPSDSSIEL
ncbi:MAG: hypothetical protein LC637_10195 [Xanthomonadaceae bacterium]|nr:hypothetical protein [Xanthomonadaceae bacterium]